MATQKFNALTTPVLHEVGMISSWKVRDIANGAKVASTPIDNFTMVELSFDSEGERICTQLSAVTNKQYLIAAVERRYLGESLAEYFNAVGERARIVIPETGLRFETSAFSLNSTLTEMAVGNVAHFDPATKKYIVSAASAPHSGYATSTTKFTVVRTVEDSDYSLGKDTVRLEVQ
jgi:hypothetical protein